MNKASIIVVVGLAGLLGACGKGDSEPKTTAAAPAPAAAPAEPATPTVAPVAAEPVAGTPTPPPPGAVADAGTASAGKDVGKGVFDKTCALCHAAGLAGAPMPGNKDQWAPRIAQGKDTLYKHAMEGFTGQAGMMPPRGGNSALTDEEIKAAVDYMVGRSS